jgi:hypothetical protein
VGDDDGQERLAESLELGTDRATVGDGEGAVDRDDSVVCLDEVGVDESALWTCGMTVDTDVLHDSSFAEACSALVNY